MLISVSTAFRAARIFGFWNLKQFVEMCNKIIKNSGSLTRQCYKVFAVLGQFWAKFITLRLYSSSKCFCKATTKTSNEFYQRGLIIINFLWIFLRHGIKIWKNWQFFSNFNSFQSLPFEATGDRKQFQYLQIAFNKKPRPLVLEFNWYKDNF